jgi:ArsR family transcriptional regulator
MNDIVSIGRAVADPTRVRVLIALVQADLCVSELAEALGLGQSTLSSHLQVIRRSGLVTTDRLHRRIRYSLSPGARPLVEAIVGYCSEALEADPQVRADLARVSRAAAGTAIR